MLPAAHVILTMGAAAAEYSLNAAPGSFAVTGVAAGALAARMVNAAPGSYALTGVAAGALAGRMINAQPGSYALTGVAASLDWTPFVSTYSLVAEPGAFAVTGFGASFDVARALVAQPGAFAISGAPAGVAASRHLDAQPASYTMIGFPAGLVGSTLQHYALNAQPGSFTVDGVDVFLHYHNVFVEPEYWEPDPSFTPEEAVKFRMKYGVLLPAFSPRAVRNAAAASGHPQRLKAKGILPFRRG